MAKSGQVNIDLSREMLKFVRALQSLPKEEIIFRSGTDICSYALIIACFHKCKLGPIENKQNYQRTFSNPPTEMLEYLYGEDAMREDVKWSNMSSLINQGLEIMRKEFDKSGKIDSIEFSNHVMNDLYFKKNNTNN